MSIPRDPTSAPETGRWLASRIFWTLLGKLAALALLYYLFFDPGHRLVVDAGVMVKALF